MNWGEIIKTLNSAPFYLVLMIFGIAVWVYGTSRRFKVDPKYRKTINTIGPILLLAGVGLGIAMMILGVIVK